MWQGHLVRLLETYAARDEAAIVHEKVRLLRLREDLPGEDINAIVREVWSLANELKLKFGSNMQVLTLENFIARLLLRQGKLEEADALLSPAVEILNREEGKERLAFYYKEKINVKIQLLSQAEEPSISKLLP